MNETRSTLVHASCVAIGGAGVLLRGPSGAGKSDLALRLIDEGARLVADDQTEIARYDDRLVARPPANLAGLIEVRGLGIVRLDYLSEMPVMLAVDLVSADEIQRMPQPATARLLGMDIPLLRLDPFPASASAKLRLAVRVAAGSIMHIP